MADSAHFYLEIKHYKARAPFRKGVNYFGGNTRTCTLERALYQIKQPLTWVSSEIKYVLGFASDILFLRNTLVIGFYPLQNLNTKEINDVEGYLSANHPLKNTPKTRAAR